MNTGWLTYPPPTRRVTQSTVVLISGRLGAVYGHQQMLLLGGVILVLFSLVNGFCKTYGAFIAIRALTGIGGGLIMPNAVAIIMMMLPPGRSRNITMSFFGASAPLGGWIGALFSGLFTQFSKWEYLFFLT
jgi:MFS family permease